MEHGPDTAKIVAMVAKATEEKASTLWVMDMNLTSLPILPTTLVNLHVFNTPITKIHRLPKNLAKLELYNTRLETLPRLPHLTSLSVRNSPLKVLPKLPWGLKYLNVNGTNLLFLPELPPWLTNLACSKAPLVIPRKKYWSRVKRYNYVWDNWRYKIQSNSGKTPEELLRTVYGREILTTTPPY